MDIVRKDLQLDFPDTSRQRGPQIDYRASHHEVLRESRNDSLLSRYTLRTQTLHIDHPAGKGVLHADWRRSAYRIEDLFQNAYTGMHPRPVMHAFGLAYSGLRGKWELRPALRYGFSGDNDTLRVNAYPRSDTDAYNRYFFDLLQPTFGDTLPLRYDLHRAGAGFYAAGTRRGMGIFASADIAYSLFRLRERHRNTGPYDKIRGPRQTLLSSGPLNIRLMSALEFRDAHMLRLSYRYAGIPLNWEHTEFPDDPDTLEVVRLASGHAERHILQFGYRFRNTRATLRVNTGAGMIRGRLSAGTPVLGYVFRILPISHQAQAEGRSRYLSGHLHASRCLQAGPLHITPRMDLLASRVCSDYAVNAQLEFGLEDISLEQEYIHAVYLIAPGLEAGLAINSGLYFTLRAEQLLPFVKTLYPELPPPPPPEIRRYGGLSVSAGVSCEW